MAGLHQRVQAAKAALRKDVKTKLLALSTEDKIQQANAVHKMLFNLPIFIESKRVSVYLSTDLEISTKEIVLRIFDDNKECFVPRYTKDDMEMVKLHSMKDWEDLPLTKWNIKQPDFSEAREDALETGEVSGNKLYVIVTAFGILCKDGLDLIIVPGVAFTKNGARMGHGKGYYDSYFSKFLKKQIKKPWTIGLALNEQILDCIPTSEHDVNLDFVLYP